MAQPASATITTPSPLRASRTARRRGRLPMRPSPDRARVGSRVWFSVVPCRLHGCLGQSASSHALPDKGDASPDVVQSRSPGDSQLNDIAGGRGFAPVYDPRVRSVGRSGAGPVDSDPAGAVAYEFPHLFPPISVGRAAYPPASPFPRSHGGSELLCSANRV